MRLELGLVFRMTSFADHAANDLVSERAALQGRLDQATAAAVLRSEAGLAAYDHALQLTKRNLSADHRDELMRALHAQQRAISERVARSVRSRRPCNGKLGFSTSSFSNDMAQKHARWRANMQSCSLDPRSTRPQRKPSSRDER